MKTTIAAHVTAVTVYPDRARVTCAGECTVEAGIQTLVFDELPLVLEPESARVTGRGTAEARLLGVDLRHAHFTVAPAAAVRELEATLEALEDARRALDDDNANWEAEARYLEGLRQATAQYARGLARGHTTVDAQAALMAHVQERDRVVRAAQRDIAVRQRELQRRIDKVAQDLAELQSARPRKRYQALVELDVSAAGELQLELSYVVRRAGWQALYDVRLADQDGDARIELTTLAQISQSTGQDWTDVALAVSTARPALNQRVPELKPWYIDQPRPQPRMMAAAAPPTAQAGDELVREALAADAAPAYAAIETVSAAAVDTGTAVQFAVSGKTTVPSDGSPHKNQLNSVKLAPDLDYLAVPRHTDAVFRRATVTVGGTGPLLAGEANLFVGEAYIGKTQLPYTPATGELELLLGVEERITVERELVRREVDKRLLRDRRQIGYGYEIRLQNLLARASAVVVKDQIPVSRHEQIRVKLETAVPEPAERSELNLLEWHLTLPAGEQATIAFGYQVEHPRDMQIAGLKD